MHHERMTKQPRVPTTAEIQALHDAAETAGDLTIASMSGMALFADDRRTRDAAARACAHYLDHSELGIDELSKVDVYLARCRAIRAARHTAVDACDIALGMARPIPDAQNPGLRSKLAARHAVLAMLVADALGASVLSSLDEDDVECPHREVMHMGGACEPCIERHAAGVRQ